MWAKLTESEVREIRALRRNTTMSLSEIARTYHVTKGAINHIIQNRTWKETQ